MIRSHPTRFPSAQGCPFPLSKPKDAIGSPNPSHSVLAPGKIPAHRRNPPMSPLYHPCPPSIGPACGSGIFHSLLTASDGPNVGRDGSHASQLGTVDEEGL